MCKKLIYLTSFVLVLGLVLTGAADAADPSLVGYWTFDEGSGTIAYDYSGQGNDGTIEGAPQWVAGKIGGAMQFDGDGDQIQLKSVFMTLGSSSNTVAAWIKVPLPDTEGLGATERVGNLLGSYNDSPNSNWELHAAGQMRMWWNGGEIDGRGTTDLRDNTWHHLAWVRDKATNASYMYIDGGLEATIATVGTDITFNTTHRIAADNRGTSTPNWHGLLDDLQVYSRALSQGEIEDIMEGIFRQIASSPSPDDKTVDVLRDVALGWKPGVFANTHDVYFGTVLDDVSDASRTNPLSVLARQNQDPNIYAPHERLAFGETYYWRVDEVNAPPDSTVYPGEIWSFTTEPVGYPIDGANIAATASGTNQADTGPENSINGSGLYDNDLHSTEATDMWLSGSGDPGSAWIEYEFDKVYKLHEMWVWNSNQPVESLVGFGFRDVTIEYSTNGTDYTTLDTTHEFARAPGVPDYAHDTTVDFSGVAAKYVRLTANSNWGGFMPQCGLSEVRFFSIPVQAREPSPDSGATDVAVDVILSFRAGRDAAEDNVYLSADEQAVIDGTVAPVSVTNASYSPSPLDLGSTYYWRIDEVNDAEMPTMWQGNVWNFATQEFIVVEDFESYNDIEDGQEGSNLIYLTWADGFDNPSTNGSTAGYSELFQPTMESGIVHGGQQSAPMAYNNTVAAFSEITRTFAAQDWTKHSVQTLTLWFDGAAGNTAGQLYVKVNDSKVMYDGDAADLRRGWQAWNIDLASVGTNLQSVTSLAIGVEGFGATGTLLLDDIRLYSYSRQLITPTEPDNAGLIGHWKFDGDTLDSSGLANLGTANGDPTYEAGKVGQAMSFDGFDDYVAIDSITASITNDDITLAGWVKTDGAGSMYWFSCNGPGNENVALFGIVDGQVAMYDGAQSRAEGHSSTLVNDSEWHHLAYSRSGSTGYTYVDGTLENTHTPNFTFADPGNRWSIGQEWDTTTASNFLAGTVDDARIYDYGLSYAEIAGLAGRTLPFDEPF